MVSGGWIWARRGNRVEKKGTIKEERLIITCIIGASDEHRRWVIVSATIV